MSDGKRVGSPAVKSGAAATGVPGLGGLKRIYRRVRKLVTGPAHIPGHRDIWSIGILRGGSPFELEGELSGANPVLTCADVSDARAVYLADPFMVRNGDRRYLFFEVLVRKNSGREIGEIGLAESGDGIQWDYRRIVLKESFHLSYPHVFEWEGSCFMVPETVETEEIRLYRAVRFPEEWVLERTLLNGGPYVDATPFSYQGRWWMFAGTGSAPMRADVLRLFHADDLRGPWKEHPESPLISGNFRTARPAGRVLFSEGKLYRFAQQCVPAYGTCVRGFEVLELSPTTYRERSVSRKPILKGSGRGWNAAGMHHIDAQQDEDGNWIACVDGWRWEKR